jgi:hypothetical protein
MKTRAPAVVFLLLALPSVLPSQARKFYIEAKGGYFMPTEQAFKEIYGSNLCWGGEIGTYLSRYFGIWAGVDYYSKMGKLTFTEEDTKLRIAPILVGAKLFVPISKHSLYLGGGIGYFQYKESNEIEVIKKGDFGFVGKAGLVLRFGAAFFFDLQGSYTSCKVKPAELEANLGGLLVGAGIGFQF